MTKIDMKPTIIAKSDQLNSDDLMAGPITITINKVTTGNIEQPISIHYDGDNGRPWKPCKTMRRVLVAIWGDDGADYVGKQLTLFRDPTVTWAGQEIGGIRIKAATDISEKQSIPVQITRGKKAPYTVEPLQAQTSNPEPVQKANGKNENSELQTKAYEIRDKIKEAPEVMDIEFIIEDYKEDLDGIKTASQAAYDMIMGCANKRREQLEAQS